MLTKWFAYYKQGDKRPYFRLVAAEGLAVAELMAGELANRDKIELVGIIIAPELYQEGE